MQATHLPNSLINQTLIVPRVLPSRLTCIELKWCVDTKLILAR